MLSSQMTVKEIATAIPQSTRVFEKLKIDYCCGGNTPLIEACAKVGVEVEEVERMLEQTQPTNASAIDPQTSSLTTLADYIVEKHHVFTRDEMARLEPLFTKVVSVHGDNHPELRQAIAFFKRLSADLTPHMLKEEHILFPYIKNLERAVMHKQPAPFAPFGTVNNPVRMMMMEHDVAGELLRELRGTTNDYALPPDACISYQTLYDALAGLELDLHQHIHLENNILFPRAVETEEVACQS
jgi:regulator of cell morphogenesis and NO signaling